MYFLKKRVTLVITSLKQNTKVILIMGNYVAVFSSSSMVQKGQVRLKQSGKGKNDKNKKGTSVFRES